MPLCDEPGAADLSPAAKDEITAFYIWHTIARRQRLLRGPWSRKPRCKTCGKPRRVPLSGETTAERETQNCASCANQRIAREKRNRATLESGADEHF